MSRDPEMRGIYLRGSIYWLAQQRAGKRVFVSLETGDLAQAIERAREVRQAPELNQGGTLASEVERFVKWKQDREEFSRQTAENARGFLSHFTKMMGAIGPGRVMLADAERFYAALKKRGMTESSAQTYIAHARSFFRWCVEVAGTVRENPFDKLKLPLLVPVARKEFCRKAQRDKLLAECPREDLRFVLYCGFHAGLRRNEIVEARPDWFDLKQRLLHIRKLGAEEAKARELDPFDLKDREERTVPLSKAFTKFLRKWLRPDDAYCLAPDKRRGVSRYRYDFRRFFDEYMAAQGCDWVTAHTMRRTFASLAASSGTSIYLIAKWLGDDVDTTTRHYGHLVPAHKELERSM